MNCCRPEPVGADKSTAETTSKPLIIDMHCHVAGIGAGDSGCFVSPKLRRNWRYGIYLKAFGINREELAQQGDVLAVSRVAEGVARSRAVDGAVLLALDGVVDARGDLDPDRTEVMIPNSFLARAVRAFPHLHFGASIHPARKDALERLAEVREQGAVLLKWLPSIQQIDPANQNYRRFFRTLVDLDLPLLVHCGHERSFSRARHDVADPLRLRLPLEEGVRVIAAHVASSGCSEGQDNMERLLGMFPDHPNLFADISSLTQLNKLVFWPRLQRRPEFFERLIYGTDFPLINTALVSPWYFLPRLGYRKAKGIDRIANPWDRDVALKRALGFPEDVFLRSAQLLKIT